MSRIIKSQYTTVDTNNIIIINGNQNAFVPQNLAQDALHYEAEITTSEAEITAYEILENAKTNAENEAAQIIQNAKLEAERIINESKQKASLDYAAELEHAKQEGIKQAIEEAGYEASRIREEAQNIKVEAHSYKQQFMEAIEPEVLELTMSIMDKMIESEKFLNRQLASIIVKQGLKQVPLADDITVHLSSEDYDQVDQLEIMKALDHVANLNLVMDVMLKPFQCIIETSLGNVDCSLDTQYAALKENLRYIFANNTNIQND
ncbi:MAG: FliH/SctL family protein [Defluviitaleaceae bacterium]|nr:FliH/SctL family protein [Defluviitaleaceae bacterium]